MVAAAIVAAIALVQFPYRTQYLHGPEEAARVLAGTDASAYSLLRRYRRKFIFNFRAQQRISEPLSSWATNSHHLFAGAALERSSRMITAFNILSSKMRKAYSLNVPGCV